VLTEKNRTGCQVTNGRSLSEVSGYTKVHIKYNILISTIYNIQQPFGPMLLDKSTFTVFTFAPCVLLYLFQSNQLMHSF